MPCFQGFVLVNSLSALARLGASVATLRNMTEPIWCPGRRRISRPLLRDYLEHRIEFYTARSWAQLEKVSAETETLQDELWQAVAPPQNLLAFQATLH